MRNEWDDDELTDEEIEALHKRNEAKRAKEKREQQKIKESEQYPTEK